MWMITTFGFFSIVEKPGDRAAGLLTIRARVREDLENLRGEALPALGEILEHAGTDYPYRAQAPKADVAAAFVKLALSIDYSNFKSAVAKRQGAKREAIYHEVWHALFPLQGKPSTTAPPPRAASSPTRPGRPTNTYGGVLIDGGKILLREPKNHYDGYVWTFPKGKADGPSDHGEPCALREVKEETGYDAAVIAKLPGQFQGGTGATEYFLMRPTGPPGTHDDETQSLRWVSFDEAEKLIEMTTNPVGRKRDVDVLGVARRTAEEMRLA